MSAQAFSPDAHGARDEAGYGIFVPRTVLLARPSLIFFSLCYAQAAVITFLPSYAYTDSNVREYESTVSTEVGC
eukprot:6207979-Pleurochrysis_carterae.AAC.2